MPAEFMDLPSEVLVHVYSNLNLTERLTLSRVSSEISAAGNWPPRTVLGLTIALGLLNIETCA